MKTHNPPHPGEIIRSLYLEPLELTVTDAAAALGVSRKNPVGDLEWPRGDQPGDGSASVDGLRSQRRELDESADAI